MGIHRKTLALTATVLSLAGAPDPGAGGRGDTLLPPAPEAP